MATSIRLMARLRTHQTPIRGLPIAWHRRTDATSRLRPPSQIVFPSTRSFASTSKVRIEASDVPGVGDSASAPVEPIINATDSIFQPLADLFLSLPPELHLSYSAFIVLTTIGLRLTVLLPLAQWARRRQKRREELVLPEVMRFKAEMFRKTKGGAELRTWPREKVHRYLALLRGSIKAETKRLDREHRCSPAGTILGTLGVSIPTLIVFSQTLRAACTTVNQSSLSTISGLSLDASGALALHPLFSETSLFSGSSLAMEDMTLALVFGAALMINGEVSYALREARRLAVSSVERVTPSLADSIGEKAMADVRKKTQQDPKAAAEMQRREAKMKDKSPVEMLRRIWTPENVRILVGATSVLMTAVAAVQPAAVTLYWFANVLCTSAQSLFFNFLDRRQDPRLIAATAAATEKETIMARQQAQTHAALTAKRTAQNQARSVPSKTRR